MLRRAVNALRFPAGGRSARSWPARREVNADGEVERGEGWWGHLHSTQDMAAGVCECSRLAGRRELVEWARRVYEWIGRAHTTRYGWVADVSGGRICASCAIASRVRLGLALHRAGAADPFDEIDRHVRNQLLENQFVDVTFMTAPASPVQPPAARAKNIAPRFQHFPSAAQEIARTGGEKRLCEPRTDDETNFAYVYKRRAAGGVPADPSGDRGRII